MGKSNSLMNPEQAEAIKPSIQASTLRERLKDHFKDRHADIDEVYCEFYQFWSQIKPKHN